MSGAICWTRIPAPRNGGQKLIQRRRARESLVPPRSCRRTLPLFMPDHDTGSRLRRNGQTTAIDGFENFVAAAAQQRFAHGVSQLFRIIGIAVARFTEKL